MGYTLPSHHGGEHRMSVYENRKLKRIFATKRGKITAGGTKRASKFVLVF
jgi:hypothetical protein